MISVPILRDFFWTVGVPLSWGWALGSRWNGARRARRAVRLGPPTISVGNLHSGGSAKTPLALEILERYRHLNPALVSRGYASESEHGGAEVDLSRADGGRLYGDEPWMIARRTGLSVFVGKDRSRWRERLSDGEFGLVVLDDGFQHRQVVRQLDLVLISSRHRVEDNFCIPQGLLREPLSALKRASAVLIVEEPDGDTRWPALLGELLPAVPRFTVRRTLAGFTRDGAQWEAAPPRAVAFAGIAWPQGFFKSVREQCNVVETRGFSDHHRYREEELEGLVERAEANSASLVTTDKDWYKVSPWFEDRGIPIYSVRMGLQMEPSFWEFLDPRLEDR